MTAFTLNAQGSWVKVKVKAKNSHDVNPRWLACQYEIQWHHRCTTSSTTAICAIHSLETDLQCFDDDDDGQRNRKNYQQASVWGMLWIGTVYCPKWVLPTLKCLEVEEQTSNRKTSVADLLTAAKECIKFRDLQRGREVHSEAIKCGEISNIYVANTLVDMYAKCGSMVEAQGVFDEMSRRSVVSWTALIMGYANKGQGLMALELFRRMQSKNGGGCAPNARTFVAVLKACTSLTADEEGTVVEANEEDEERGKKRKKKKKKKKKVVKKRCLEMGIALHREAVERRFSSDMFVANSLIDMYVKCGSMGNAMEVFDKMRRRSVVSWTSLVLGYAYEGESAEAIRLFMRMRLEGCVPDAQAFVAVLKACTSFEAEVNEEIVEKKEWLGKALAIQSEATKTGYDSNVFVASTLVDVFAKCGSMVHARAAFDKMRRRTTVSWTALILGYAENGYGRLGLEMYKCMLVEKECVPDGRTFSAALKACISVVEEEGEEEEEERKMWCLEKGIAIHDEARKKGCDLDVFVANSLIDMYAKCKSMKKSRMVFDKMLWNIRTVVTWTTLMMGYVENDEPHIALEIFEEMQKNSNAVTPNAHTYVAALKACGKIEALERGKKIHSEIRCEIDDVLSNCLLDLYGKCGSMSDAEQVFDSIVEKNVMHWTCLMSGYNRKGDSELVFDVFRRMQKQRNVKANGVTFLCLLTACSQNGLIDKGKEYFEMMQSSKYNITPTIEHYNCMIGILCGNKSEIEDAVRLAKSMPYKASAVTWVTILSACNEWRNVNVGKVAFDALLRLNERDVACAYVLMANIYANAGMLKEKLNVEVMKLKSFQSN